MALEVKLIEPPKYGTVAWNGVKWVYTPNTNYPENTTDSWLYALNVDGVVSKGITEYYNPKNQVPFSVNPLFLVDPRSKYTISVRDLVVDDYISLANLKILYISTPKNGKIAINDNQDSFTYEANNALDALDELSYTVTDGQYLTEGVLKIKYVSPVFLGSKITDYVAYLKSIVDRFAIVPPTSGNWNAATTAISSISAEWVTLNTEKYNAAFDYVEANDAFLITSYQKDPIYSGLTSLIQTYSASWDSVRVDATNLQALISPLTAVWQSNTLLLNEKYFSWNDNIPLYNRLNTLYSSNTSKYDDVYAFINTLSSTFDPTAFSNTYGSLSSKWEDVTNTVTTKRKDFGYDVFQTRKYDSFVNVVSTLSSNIPALNTLTTTKNAYWASNSSISSISARALSGAGTQNVVSRNLDVYNDLIIRNNLRVLGPKTQIDTTLNTLCSFEIKNTSTNDAFTVDKTGLGNVLRLGNTLYVKSFGKVGINIDPTLDSETLTVVGNISASGKIYPDTIGDQMTLYKSVSSRYENTFTYFTANSATFNTIRLSLPSYDNAYDYVRTNSGDISRLLAPDYSAFDAFTKSSSGGSVLGLTLTGGNYLSTAPQTIDFASNNFTVEAWIKMPTLPTSTTNTYTASSYTLIGCSGTTGISFVIGAAQMFCFANNALTTGIVHNLSANRWHHVAYVRNGTILDFYVDGSKKGSHTFAANTIITTPAKCFIGAFNPPTDGRFFKGAISNLKITNGQALYTTNFTPNPNKFLNDSFIETVPLYYNDVSLLLNGEDTIAKDKSFRNNPITLVGNISSDSIVVPYAGCKSMRFDGTSHMSVPITQALNLGGPTDWTVEFWFRSDVVTPDSSVLGMQDFSTFTIRLGSTVKILADTTGSTPWEISSESASPTILANTWYHFAVTKKGVLLRGYLNGSLTYSKTLTTHLFSTLAGNIFIGAFTRNGINVDSTVAKFKGYLADFRIIKGKALYDTSYFTPVSSSLRADYHTLTASNVSLLALQSNEIKDNSILNRQLSTVGVMAYEPTSVTTPRLSAIGAITMATLSTISAVMDKDADFRVKANSLNDAVTFVNNTIPAGYNNTDYFYQFNNVTGTTVNGLVYIPQACKINEVSVYADVSTSLEVDVLSCINGVIDFPNQAQTLINKTIGASPIVLNSEIKKTDKILNNWITTLNGKTTIRIDIKSNTMAKDVLVVINTSRLT